MVDGETYPDAVRDALAELPYDFVAVKLVGGTDKLRGTPDYGVPLVHEAAGVDVVVDLTDDRPAASAPLELHPFLLPSIAVIGTGKRVGKTAVTAHVARLLARECSVVCVAMGRGGPREPELVTEPPTIADLVARSRAGQHAASDYLELAALTGVPAIGCRRVGMDGSGAPLVTNVLDGAALAESLGPDVVLFDGSGASIPPLAVTKRILVGAEPDAHRAAISDVVLRPGVDFTLRLRPTAPLEGRVAVFTTGPADVDHLDADVVHVSRNLARRDALAAELAVLDADTYLVELKAAAIDTVAEHALARGARVVLADNEPVGLDLDALLRSVAPARMRA